MADSTIFRIFVRIFCIAHTLMAQSSISSPLLNTIPVMDLLALFAHTPRFASHDLLPAAMARRHQIRWVAKCVYRLVDVIC